ncbi:MAG: hypothetical protein PWQ83_1554 [Thermosipho sp. (in: thermotogales)]|nr:hypothetical protein [Thermosipho sp. (in: thermotogales)]
MSDKLKIALFGFILISSLLFSIGNDYLSNRFTKPDEKNRVINDLNTEGFKLIAESEKLELWFDEKNYSIRILNKESGYLWGLVDSENLSGMNNIWKGIASSVLTIEYFDDNALNYLLSISDKSVIKKYSKLENGIKIEANYESLAIKLKLYIYLNDDHIEFYIPYESIDEKGNFKLASIYIAPFLGAVRENKKSGYIFIPDGPGALIRFSKSSLNSSMFEKRIYGKDYSIDNLREVSDLKASRPNDFLREEPSIYMPVFGIVHGVNQNAIFGRIISGAEYSSIVAYPSGVISPFYWASFKFIYRQKYLQPTTRSGNGIQVPQKLKNKLDVRYRVYFLTGEQASYVGMAKFYRNILVKEGVLVKKPKSGNIPLSLDFVVSELEKKVLGFNSIKVTTYNYIKECIDYFKHLGVNKLNIFLEGWQERGRSGNKISKFSFEKSVGGKDGLLSLYKKFNDNDIKIYLVENVTKVTQQQININKEAGTNLSQSLIYEDKNNRDLWFFRSYYTNIKLSSDYLKEKALKMNELGIKNLALKEYGIKLYGELLIDNEIYRNQAKELIIKTIANISKNINVSFFNANDYLWKYTNSIINIPMNNSQYLYETDTVPFLQILLSGYIEYFVPFMNDGFFSKLDVLKAIDFGAYPNFILTEIDNYYLAKTPLLYYPSTKFEDWKNSIVDIYKEINKALKHVRGFSISDRDVIAPGIVLVSYENGVSFLINYTENKYEYGNFTVLPESWILISKGEDKYE